MTRLTAPIGVTGDPSEPRHMPARASMSAATRDLPDRAPAFGRSVGGAAPPSNRRLLAHGELCDGAHSQPSRFVLTAPTTSRPFGRKYLGTLISAAHHGRSSSQYGGCGEGGLAVVAGKGIGVSNWGWPSVADWSG
jgi:hypothetical protein